MFPNDYLFMYKLYEKKVLALVNLKTIFLALVVVEISSSHQLVQEPYILKQGDTNTLHVDGIWRDIFINSETALSFNTLHCKILWRTRNCSNIYIATEGNLCQTETNTQFLSKQNSPYFFLKLIFVFLSASRHLTRSEIPVDAVICTLGVAWLWIIEIHVNVTTWSLNI
jgi:hypothetical protein